jgi:hypothetical protein
MLRSCLFCQGTLPPNEVLDQFPVGRRVAYDPARGRLWAVCPACARWNLAPIEERWEALEELEKLTRDRSRLLARTDNIALLRAPGLEVVKVGRARLREEAWWRYGYELTRRRQRSARTAWLDVALALTIGAPVIHHLARGLAFSAGAWAGVRRCDNCGASAAAGALSMGKVRSLFLERTGSGEVALRLECRYCAARGATGGVLWTGADAGRILRTSLAYENFGGARPSEIDDACRRVGDAGSAAVFVDHVARQRPRIAEFHRGVFASQAVALEIALNDDLERRRLDAELDELDAEWQDAEIVAAIADRELTPPPLPPAGPERLPGGEPIE